MSEWKMTDDERLAFNLGLSQAQWQVSKAMMGLSYTRVLDKETKQLLKFIYDEIEKEKK